MRGFSRVKSLIFASVWLTALCTAGQAQENPPRATEALPERLEAARVAGRAAGRAEALEAVKRGQFNYTGAPRGPWAVEFQEELRKNGIRWGDWACGNELLDLAQRNPAAAAELLAKVEAFDETMSRELIRRFGSDFIQRAEAAAKQAYEKKLRPAATPQPRRKRAPSR
jgi:hypothetical protein